MYLKYAKSVLLFVDFTGGVESSVLLSSELLEETPLNGRVPHSSNIWLSQVYIQSSGIVIMCGRLQDVTV